MKKVKEFLKFYLPPSPFEWLLIAMMPLIMLTYKNHGGIVEAGWRVEELVYWFSSIALFHFIYRVLSLFIKRGVAIFTLNFFLFLIYFLLYIYHLRVGHPLDFAVIAENFGLAAKKESLGVLLDIPARKDFYRLAIAIVVFIFVQWRWRLFSKRVKSSLKSLDVLISLLLFLAILQVANGYYDEYGPFFQSVYRYYFPQNSKIPPISEQQLKNFPPTKKITSSNIIYNGCGRRPDVFIIFVESFNANFVERRTKEGKEFTPFFNQLIREGIYFENFYGNSMQTAKGQLATLCSVLPLVRGKVFTDISKVQI